MSRFLSVFFVLFLASLCGSLIYVLVVNDSQLPRIKQGPPSQDTTRIEPLNYELKAAKTVLQLTAPLSTYSPQRQAPLHNCAGIEAAVFIPDDAPEDLGVGAYIKDQDGNWFQSPITKALGKGKQEFYFTLDKIASWHAEPYGCSWNAYRLGRGVSYGLYFWSQEQTDAHISIEHLRAVGKTQGAQQNIYTCKQLQILNLDGYVDVDAHCEAYTGQRWEAHFNPDHLPENPFNNQLLKIDAVITDQDGASKRYPAFYFQEIQLSDGGSHERSRIHKPGHYTLRYRPQRAGRYHITLDVQSQGHRFSCNLPDLVVSGDDYDDYIRIDKDDPRFFTIGQGSSSQFFWPIGINLRSVNDSRGHENTPCISTPTRGSISYNSFLERYSSAGANCAEVWMCSWNLALEWKRKWPGFYGAGFYHEANAKRLDRILDIAHERNMRIILVLNNHGQASSKVDSEWKLHPYNKANGGFLKRPHEIYTEAQAFAHQEQLRRYIIARYADHPAVMCWKLWTEQDLTDVGLQTRNPYRGRTNKILRDWHQQACMHIKSIDHYGHPIVTHWSTDYTIVDKSVATLKELDAVFIDAYHHRVQGHRLLADLLYQSIADPRRGLGIYKKPILCTEFGGTPMACPEPQLLAEHMSGPWAAVVSGHAGSPLLWWFEWVDQHDRWHPYRAISAFMKGEDLRAAKARSVKLNITTKESLWARAWARKGRILGYVLDIGWGYDGRKAKPAQNVNITVGSNIAAGQMRVEWWDASLGKVIQRQDIQHAGGVLEITIPTFLRHVAFKLYRL